MRLTRRYIVKGITQLPLSTPIRYERYYIHDRLRIQKKGNDKEKEILNEENVIIKKETITDEEFQTLQVLAYAKIIRDSYLLLTDENISIKQYLDKYEGLNRVEVSFQTEKEMREYHKKAWMGKEITSSPLAFDKDLSKLTRKEFLTELEKYVS